MRPVLQHPPARRKHRNAGFNPLSCGQCFSTEACDKKLAEMGFNPLSCGQCFSTSDTSPEAVERVSIRCHAASASALTRQNPMLARYFFLTVRGQRAKLKVGEKNNPRIGSFSEIQTRLCPPSEPDFHLTCPARAFLHLMIFG